MEIRILSAEDVEQLLPSVTGVVVVLDARTGLPGALLDAHRLTSIRTGATGGPAADLLARKEAETVAVIGAGQQAGLGTLVHL